MSPKAQILLVALFYFVLSALGEKLVAKYDHGDPKKLFRIGQPLILQCKPHDKADGSKIYWTKEGNNLTFSTEEKAHQYKVVDEGKFIIEKSREDDAGNYACNILDVKTDAVESHSFDVIAQVIVRVVTDTQVTEGERVEIICVVKGSNPEVKWYFSADTEDETPNYNDVVFTERLKLESKGDFDHVLTIDKSELSDRGYYRCNATNEQMKYLSMPEASDAKLVRVKDKMAPVWPAVGILAQIVVLALIIVISERRRNQNEVDESDTDEAPEKKEEANFIRHRN